MVVRHNWHQRTEDRGLRTDCGVATRLLFSVFCLLTSVI